MPSAVIVDAVRTAGGKRNGKLRGWHPVDLAAETLKALVERNDLDPAVADDVVVAAGVEGMTRTPMGASVVPGLGAPFGPKMMARYASVGGLVPQGISAELIADKWGLSREDLDRFGATSQQRAARATAEGRFQREIVPVAQKDDDGNDTDEIVDTDEGIRPDTTVESLAQLKPAFKKDD